MFDPAWEAQHVERPWGRWPNEHLVRFVARHYRDDRRHTFLDLGCGAGAQTAFLADEGHDVHAVDGSSAAIERAQELLHRRCEFVSIRGESYGYGNGSIINWRAGDLVEQDYPEGAFDCVVDVATLQHLSDEDAVLIVERARRWLKPGGRFFSIHASLEADSDVVSRGHTVMVRQAGRAEIMGLFHGYDLDLGREVVERPTGGRVAHWIVEAQRSL